MDTRLWMMHIPPTKDNTLPGIGGRTQLKEKCPNSSLVPGEIALTPSNLQMNFFPQ
jgi:hypothetical protein